MAGPLEYLSDLLRGRGSRKHKKMKQMQTVELKVRMDCDGCELKVKNSVSSMKGVRSVDVNRKEQRVTVTGYVEANKVLKKVKATGKRAELWPYVPYSLVAQPYAAQAYDKKAPAGYVRKVESNTFSNPNPTDEQYTTLFSDDNANACQDYVRLNSRDSSEMEIIYEALSREHILFTKLEKYLNEL